MDHGHMVKEGVIFPRPNADANVVILEPKLGGKKVKIWLSVGI